MSFTQDELQAFNSILESRLAAHRREMERSLDQRMAALKRDFEHRFTTLQRDMQYRFPQRIAEQQRFASQPVRDDSKQKIGTAPQDTRKQETEGLFQSVDTRSSDLERAMPADGDPAQQLESAVERGLAAQLLAIEQLLNQRIPAQTSEWSGSLVGTIGEQGDLEGIEIQTDLPWEELVEVVDMAMDQRIALLKESIQINIKEMVSHVSIELNAMRQDLARLQVPTYNGDMTNIREVFASIEQLERIIESMQVAMNANHALLSNRMFHHQQLPLERAHPSNNSTLPLAAHDEQKNGITKPLPLLKGHEGDQQQS